jgi:hypothetical protein
MSKNFRISYVWNEIYEATIITNCRSEHHETQLLIKRNINAIHTIISIFISFHIWRNSS